MHFVPDTKMNSALQELKSLLLSKSIKTFNSTEQGIAIVNTLQSLLKVAEMRNKCCFFEDCAHPTLAVQNKFSLNISFENDKLLLLTGQSITSNNLVATEFDGQSDEDSSSTDNSYETADEGYDVSILFDLKYLVFLNALRIRIFSFILNRLMVKRLNLLIPIAIQCGRNRQKCLHHRFERILCTRAFVKLSMRY